MAERPAAHRIPTSRRGRICYERRLARGQRRTDARYVEAIRFRPAISVRRHLARKEAVWPYRRKEIPTGRTHFDCTFRCGAGRLAASYSAIATIAEERANEMDYSRTCQSRSRRLSLADQEIHRPGCGVYFCVAGQGHG